MSELVRLLRDLGQNAELAQAYENDPDAVLEQYDLTDAEIEALKSGDLDKLRELSGLDDMHITKSTVKCP